MRTLSAFALALGVLVMPALDTGTTLSAASVGSAVSASNLQDKPVINVEINKPAPARAWYTSPVWVAIGVLAAVVVLLLLVMAVRGGGGGTTVVRG